MEAYIPIAILFVIAMGLCLTIFALTTILGPRKTMATRFSTYECGVSPEGGAHVPFRNRFYLIAVLFLIVDLEGAFFFPWALIYRESLGTSPMLFIAFIAYLVFMVLGIFFILRKDALELLK